MAISDLEQECFHRATEVIHELGPEIRAAKLELRVHPIRRAGSGSDYQSEISIDVWGDDDLLDVIEFHIVRSGQPTVSPQDVSAWLVDTLRIAIATARIDAGDAGWDTRATDRSWRDRL